jgi:CRISPR-associated endonuclease Cas1
MPTLYVTEPGAYLEKEYQRLVVSKDDERLMRVPLLHVSDVVLVGRVGVTTPALHTLLENGVPLSLLNASGRLLGRLVPPALYNIPLRHKQYERARDPAFCLKVARAIAAAKIRNERALARRILRTRDWIPASEADRLTEANCQTRPTWTACAGWRERRRAPILACFGWRWPKAGNRRAVRADRRATPLTPCSVSVIACSTRM